MELLGSALEFSSWLGEFCDRTEDKDQELTVLSSTVTSVSQSMKTFSAFMTPAEKENAFRSNEVFFTTLNNVLSCRAIIDKKREQAALEDQKAALALEDSKSSNGNGWLGRVGGAISQVKTGVAGIRKEASEALGGKLGKIGLRLRLPEDELAKLRASREKLQSLVPLVQLAIQTYTCSQLATSTGPQGMERETSGDPAPKRRRLEDQKPETRPLVHFIDVCPLRLQLVSEDPRVATTDASKPCELEQLHASELRPAGSSGSTSSFNGECGSDALSALRPRQRIFGRQELRGKIDIRLNLPAEKGGEPLPPWRFVSRDLFLLEVPERPVIPASAEADDSLEMATLAFGGSAPHPFDDPNACTLEMGGGFGDSASPAKRHPLKSLLATVTSLSNSGLHVRLAGETQWQWKAKDTSVVIYEGDRVALLLESPPGSFKPGPTKNLGAEEAVCLLGLDVRPPLEEKVQEKADSFRS